MPERNPMQPIAAAQFAALAITHGWSVQGKHETDTGNSPFITILAIRGTERLELTWHTRNTGTYRLSSAIRGRGNGARDVTLTKARALIEANHAS